MRWFGPADPVSLRDIAQAGCTGVVTALHHIPVGDVWTAEEILRRKAIIEAEGLRWTVVESLPVHEEIKQNTARAPHYIAQYQESLRNLAACGLKVITYNFMPILDWVRTDVAYTLPNGSKALYFHRLAFVAFDLYILDRPGAQQDYTADEQAAARTYLASLTPDAYEALRRNVMLGLPGSEEPFTREGILSALSAYADIDSKKLKQHLVKFLRAVAPVADALGLQLAIHPDDPPFSVLGLPRIMSTAQDMQDIFEAVPEASNGLCFCTGSLGARPDNDILQMLRQYAERIYFLHLRNTRREPSGNFYEANHLEGDTDMVSVVQTVLAIMQQRGASIPMRPDHGHQMLDDLNKKTYPGYSAIGRLKGLAELRGLEHGLAAVMRNKTM